MNKPDFITKEHLEYLDALRDSGETNMFSAGIYLRREFELSGDMARTILTYWMKAFSEQHKED